MLDAGTDAILSGMRRYCLLLLPLLLLAGGCAVEDPGNTVAGHYSGAFAAWMYPSIGIPHEIEALRRDLPFGAEARLRERMTDIMNRQAALNRNFEAAEPPPKWRDFHERIAQALASFDAVSGEIKQASSEPLPELLRKLASEQELMRRRVIDCYAQSPTCR
jgi:hypothetical protein